MIVNKFRKKCQSCNTVVGVGEGFAYNNGTGWFTACASSACHRKLGIKAPGSNSNSTRKITADGKIYTILF